MRNLKSIVVLTFSIGWVAPLWLAAWLFVDFWQVEGWPLLLQQKPGNSFEWFGLIKTCLNFGSVWLMAVLTYWSWIAISRMETKRSA